MGTTEPVRDDALWMAWKHAAEAVRQRIGADITRATGLSDGDFGIVRVDAGTRRTDQWNCIRLRFVDLDELLQGMNEFFAQILR